MFLVLRCKGTAKFVQLGCKVMFYPEKAEK